MASINLVRIVGISIFVLFVIAVVIEYRFLWPVLLFVAISHLPVKEIKK